MRRALLAVLLAAPLLPSCKDEGCDELRPCGASQTCVDGVCVARSIGPGDSCKTSGTCGKGQLCVDEEGGDSVCRLLCETSHTCADPATTCVCTSDPRYQYCRPISRFALTACFRDPGLGISTGLCTTACNLAAAGTPEEWCACPYQMFGSKVSCTSDRGNATTYNPLCAPALGEVSKWPTCATDGECKGKYAAP